MTAQRFNINYSYFRQRIVFEHFLLASSFSGLLMITIFISVDQNGDIIRPLTDSN